MQPDARLPANQGRPAGVIEGVGTLVGRPAAVPVGVEPGVDHVAAVTEQEDQGRVREEVHDRVGCVRARLLHDDDRPVDPARGGDVLGRLSREAGADQVAELGHPGVAEPVGEEVVAFLALEVGEGAELGRVLGCRPGQGDRTPDTQVVSDVGVVDRDHAIQLGKHSQQPGAAASRRSEDPGQPPRRRYVRCDSLWHVAPQLGMVTGSATSMWRSLKLPSDGSSQPRPDEKDETDQDADQT